METIGQQCIWSFAGRVKTAKEMTNEVIRRCEPFRVHNYLELAQKVAELQFLNRDHVLVFRGQRIDYKDDQRETTLKPSLFRAISTAGRPPNLGELELRFERLDRAARELVRRYQQTNWPGRKQLERQRIVRWSILQHYEVCDTPLLDVTHSLRIAASFASLAGGKDNALAHLMVLGVPNLSGAITASAEAGLQIVRLASVCPPVAMRPHIQEGYLIGEYPEISKFSEKAPYPHWEVDFGRRLIAKFCFDPKEFWRGQVFPKVGKRALYPASKDDPLFELTIDVKQAIGN